MAMMNYGAHVGPFAQKYVRRSPFVSKSRYEPYPSGPYSPKMFKYEYLLEPPSQMRLEVTHKEDPPVLYVRKVQLFYDLYNGRAARHSSCHARNFEEDGGVLGGGLGQESICPKVKEGHDENPEGLPQDSRIGERRGTNDVSSTSRDDTKVQQDFDRGSR